MSRGVRSVVAIVYGSSTLNTEFVSTKLLHELGEGSARMLNVKDVTPEDLLGYSGFIFVTSTWGRGDLQDDWELFLPRVKAIDFTGKRVALVGLGDQKNYPDQFCDSIGHLYDTLHDLGVTVVGETSVEGYEFKRSYAVRKNRFVGLVLDEDNQSDLTDDRIRGWVRSIRKEFVQ